MGSCIKQHLPHCKSHAELLIQCAHLLYMQAGNTGSFEERTSLFCKWKPALVTPESGNRDLDLLFLSCSSPGSNARCPVMAADLRGQTWRGCSQWCSLGLSGSPSFGWHMYSSSWEATHCHLQPKSLRSSKLVGYCLTVAMWVSFHNEDSTLWVDKAVGLHTTGISRRLCFSVQQMWGENVLLKAWPNSALCFPSAILVILVR